MDLFPDRFNRNLQNTGNFAVFERFIETQVNCFLLFGGELVKGIYNFTVDLLVFFLLNNLKFDTVLRFKINSFIESVNHLFVGQQFFNQVSFQCQQQVKLQVFGRNPDFFTFQKEFKKEFLKGIFYCLAIFTKLCAITVKCINVEVI